MGERGYLNGLMGLHKYPTQYTNHRVRSVGPEQWDLFHEMIVTDEISRAGSGGLVWNLIGGFGIGCPPLVKFGKKAVVDRVLPSILNGDKRICLAITEPDAGSDVANLTCEAKLTEDGKHYIVNGEKKWITNGVWCDYFTTAVRTGGEGAAGVSMLLIERDQGGVNTRRMDCQGVWSSGTTYITFEDVKVPVENLIGKENQGFKGKRNSPFSFTPPPFYLYLSKHPPNQSYFQNSDNDKLQPRAHRNHHPMSPLLARLLRRIHKIRPQAPHIQQTPHRPPRHPPQTSPHGASDRSILQLARKPDLSMPDDERDRSDVEARWRDRRPEGAGYGHV